MFRPLSFPIVSGFGIRAHRESCAQQLCKFWACSQARTTLPYQDAFRL
jgi:hypothetical protein